MNLVNLIDGKTLISEEENEKIHYSCDFNKFI